MKRIEQQLNRKILEARQDVERTRRQLRDAKKPVGAAVAEWAVKRAESELGYLLHLAADE